MPYTGGMPEQTEKEAPQELAGDERKEATAETVQIAEVVDGRKVHKPGRNYNRKGRPPGPRNGETLRKKRDAKILSLAIQGIPQADIAKAVEVSAGTVCNVLKEFKDTFQHLPQIGKYRESRVDLLDATELQLLKSLNDPDKLARAQLHNVAFSLDKVAMLNRLWQGKSTENIQNYIKVED